jgi:hypothetical protein
VPAAFIIGAMSKLLTYVGKPASRLRGAKIGKNPHRRENIKPHVCVTCFLVELCVIYLPKLTRKFQLQYFCQIQCKDFRTLD